MEQLIRKDLHHLEELEDQIGFLPLSLLTGWYGMNFTGMNELSWEYGYEAVICAGILIVCLSIWIMKKKKFW